MEDEAAARRQRRASQHGIGALGIGQHLADDALRVRVGVEDVHVDAGEQEPGYPAPADDTAADNDNAKPAKKAAPAAPKAPSAPSAPTPAPMPRPAGR